MNSLLASGLAPCGAAHVPARLDVDDGGVRLEAVSLDLVRRVGDDLDGVLDKDLGDLDAGAPRRAAFLVPGLC